MAAILLFHHVLGPTPGMDALAERLTAAGHKVRMPDLFEGERFDDIASGIEHLSQIGIPTVLGRARDAAEAGTAPEFVVGISMGGMAAQYLAQTRPGVKGAVMLESFVPPDAFGPWPAGVRGQVHGLERDPEFALSGDLAAARAFCATEPAVELFVYDGDGHLFMDRSLASWHAGHADTVTHRMLAFLAQ